MLRAIHHSCCKKRQDYDLLMQSLRILTPQQRLLRAYFPFGKVYFQETYQKKNEMKKVDSWKLLLELRDSMDSMCNIVTFIPGHHPLR